jgi:hypothetical protein
MKEQRVQVRDSLLGKELDEVLELDVEVLDLRLDLIETRLI